MWNESDGDNGGRPPKTPNRAPQTNMAIDDLKKRRRRKPSTQKNDRVMQLNDRLGSAELTKTLSQQQTQTLEKSAALSPVQSEINNVNGRGFEPEEHAIIKVVKDTPELFENGFYSNCRDVLLNVLGQLLHPELLETEYPALFTRIATLLGPNCVELINKRSEEMVELLREDRDYVFQVELIPRKKPIIADKLARQRALEEVSTLIAETEAAINPLDELSSIKSDTDSNYVRNRYNYAKDGRDANQENAALRRNLRSAERQKVDAEQLFGNANYEMRSPRFTRRINANTNQSLKIQTANINDEIDAENEVAEDMKHDYPEGYLLVQTDDKIKAELQPDSRWFNNTKYGNCESCVMKILGHLSNVEYVMLRFSVSQRNAINDLLGDDWDDSIKKKIADTKEFKKKNINLFEEIHLFTHEQLQLDRNLRLPKYYPITRGESPTTTVPITVIEGDTLFQPERPDSFPGLTSQHSKNKTQTKEKVLTKHKTPTPTPKDTNKQGKHTISKPLFRQIHHQLTVIHEGEESDNELEMEVGGDGAYRRKHRKQLQQFQRQHKIDHETNKDNTDQPLAKRRQRYVIGGKLKPPKIRVQFNLPAKVLKPTGLGNFDDEKDENKNEIEIPTPTYNTKHKNNSGKSNKTKSTAKTPHNTENGKSDKNNQNNGGDKNNKEKKKSNQQNNQDNGNQRNRSNYNGNQSRARKPRFPGDDGGDSNGSSHHSKSPRDLGDGNRKRNKKNDKQERDNTPDNFDRLTDAMQGLFAQNQRIMEGFLERIAKPAQQKRKHSEKEEMLLTRHREQQKIYAREGIGAKHVPEFHGHETPLKLGIMVYKWKKFYITEGYYKVSDGNSRFELFMSFMKDNKFKGKAKVKYDRLLKQPETWEQLEELLAKTYHFVEKDVYLATFLDQANFNISELKGFEIKSGLEKLTHKREISDANKCFATPDQLLKTCVRRDDEIFNMCMDAYKSNNKWYQAIEHTRKYHPSFAGKAIKFSEETFINLCNLTEQRLINDHNYKTKRTNEPQKEKGKYYEPTSQGSSRDANVNIHQSYYDKRKSRYGRGRGGRGRGNGRGYQPPARGDRNKPRYYNNRYGNDYSNRRGGYRGGRGRGRGGRGDRSRRTDRSRAYLNGKTDRQAKLAYKVPTDITLKQAPARTGFPTKFWIKTSNTNYEDFDQPIYNFKRYNMHNHVFIKCITGKLDDLYRSLKCHKCHKFGHAKQHCDVLTELVPFKITQLENRWKQNNQHRAGTVNIMTKKQETKFKQPTRKQFKQLKQRLKAAQKQIKKTKKQSQQKTNGNGNTNERTVTIMQTEQQKQLESIAKNNGVKINTSNSNKRKESSKRWDQRS